MEGFRVMLVCEMDLKDTKEPVEKVGENISERKPSVQRQEWPAALPAGFMEPAFCFCLFFSL